MAERYEETCITSHGDHQHQERIVVDETARSRRLAYQVSSFIWLLFGLLIGSISLRIFLQRIGANPGAPFAELVYTFTDLFLWPFSGLTISPAVKGMVLEIPSIIAIVFYAFLGWAVVKITELPVLRP